MWFVAPFSPAAEAIVLNTTKGEFKSHNGDRFMKQFEITSGSFLDIMNAAEEKHLFWYRLAQENCLKYDPNLHFSNWGCYAGLLFRVRELRSFIKNDDFRHGVVVSLKGE